MTQLTMRPVHVGSYTAFEMSSFTYGANFGRQLVAPCVIWLIDGADARVVVDAGPADPDWMTTYHLPFARRLDQEPAEALRSAGCPPEDVDVLILTHLHYDHCFNANLFSRAHVYVQSEELRYAVAPLEVHKRVYETEMPGLGAPRWMAVFDRILPVHGDCEILPGISSVLLPGHSPGLMGVKVETADGPYVLASDAVPLFANWEGAPEHGIRHFIPGIHYDVRTCLSTYEKLDRLGCHILPGHDPRLLERATYP